MSVMFWMLLGSYLPVFVPVICSCVCLPVSLLSPSPPLKSLNYSCMPALSLHVEAPSCAPYTNCDNLQKTKISYSNFNQVFSFQTLIIPDNVIVYLPQHSHSLNLTICVYKLQVRYFRKRIQKESAVDVEKKNNLFFLQFEGLAGLFNIDVHVRWWGRFLL